MSQITKCYKVTVVLTYWEASVEVLELSYTSLLFISSKWSYCTWLLITSSSCWPPTMNTWAPPITPMAGEGCIKRNPTPCVRQPYFIKKKFTKVLLMTFVTYWTNTVTLVALVSPTLVSTSTRQSLVTLVTYSTIWVGLIPLVNLMLAHKVLVSKSNIVVVALLGNLIGLVGLVGFRSKPTKTRWDFQSIGGKKGGGGGLRIWLPPWHGVSQIVLLSPNVLCEIIDRIVRPWPIMILNLASGHVCRVHSTTLILNGKGCVEE